MFIEKRFQGSAEGGDEILIVTAYDCKEALVVVSWGMDYGSGMRMYRANEEQIAFIDSKEFPGTSYKAEEWIKYHLTPLNNNDLLA